MTSNFCVVGSPISHSLSPLIHSAAYKHLGLDYSYEQYEVEAGELEVFVSNHDFAGLSVTMPLKLEAYHLASVHDHNSLLSTVANTLVRVSDTWAAHNTDVAGFVRTFSDIKNLDMVTVIGSGATARSATLALAKLNPLAQISFMGRSNESLEAVMAFANEIGMSARVALARATELKESDLVVSSVPGNSFEGLWQEVSEDSSGFRGTLFDVSYNPWPSAAAVAWHGQTISGIELLIWQAIEQIRHFSEAQGDTFVDSSEDLHEVMLQAVRSETGLK